MLTGSLVAASSSADWLSEEFAAVDDDGAAIDLDGFLIEVEVRDAFGTRVLSGSTANGIVSIVDNLITWEFPASSMLSLRADQYAVYLRLTDSVTGAIKQLFVGTVNIYEGGFR